MRRRTAAVGPALGGVLLLAGTVGAAEPAPVAPIVQEASAVDGEPGRRAPQDRPAPPPDPLREAPPERRPGADTLTAARVDALAAEVADQLRCPVCRNQSVLESSAELSREMQSVIRERLAAGHTPEEVKAYFVERYGEWILLRPEPEGINLAVYLLPALVLLGGGWWVGRRLRSWVRSSPDATEPEPVGSEEEQRWLERALREG